MIDIPENSHIPLAEPLTRVAEMDTDISPSDISETDLSESEAEDLLNSYQDSATLNTSH